VLPDQNSNSNTKKKRILAVDDEPDITLTVKAGLEATILNSHYPLSNPDSTKPGLLHYQDDATTTHYTVLIVLSDSTALDVHFAYI
jgi:hypothetical protein